MSFLGVDACAKGWAGILLTKGGRVSGHFATTIPELVERCADAAPVLVIAVDMPIGLPDGGLRAADTQARKFLGPRRSSVFPTPVRKALEADTYAAASAVNRHLAGSGISKQSYALRPRLLEVDEWVRGSDLLVVEVHPEVSFAEMAGHPLPDAKRSWAGMSLRRSLLETHAIIVPDDLEQLGRMAAVDDVLDAAAAAWTARRVFDGRARPMPDPPESFSDGLPCAIWR